MKKAVSVLLVTVLCVCLVCALAVPAWAEQHLDGTLGVQYPNMYEEDLGFVAVSIAVNEGAAPAGITASVSGSRLWISGTPAETGNFQVNYRVYSDTENYVLKYFSFTISAPAVPQAVLSTSDNKLVLSVSGIDVASGYTVYYFANTQNSTSGGIQLNSTGITSNTASAIFQVDFNTLPEKTYYFYASVLAGSNSFKSNAIQMNKPEDAVVKVTKSPTGENVNEGESAMFISAAENYTKVEWRIVSADGSVCWRNKNEIEGKFLGVSFEAYKAKDGREVLVLSNIPASLDGYYIETKFWGKDDKDTQLTKSHSAELKVKASSLAKPVFTSQPADVSEEAGTPASLSAPATASSGTVKYQWYMNTVKSTSGAAKIDGATSSNFTPPQNVGTYYYFCTVWVEKDSKTSEVVYSDVAEVTYAAAPVEESPEVTVSPEVTPSPEPAEDDTEDKNDTGEETKKKDDNGTSPVMFGIIALLGAGLAGGIAALVAKRSSSAKSAAAEKLDDSAADYGYKEPEYRRYEPEYDNRAGYGNYGQSYGDSRPAYGSHVQGYSDDRPAYGSHERGYGDNRPAYGEREQNFRNDDAVPDRYEPESVNAGSEYEESKPEPAEDRNEPESLPRLRCVNCGWMPENPENVPRFCPRCGGHFGQ